MFPGTQINPSSMGIDYTKFRLFTFFRWLLFFCSFLFYANKSRKYFLRDGKFLHSLQLAERVVELRDNNQKILSPINLSTFPQTKLSNGLDIAPLLIRFCLKHYRVSQRGFPRFVPLEPYKQVSLHTAQPIPLGLSYVRYFFPILAGLYLLAFGPLSGGFCFPGFQ